MSKYYISFAKYNKKSTIYPLYIKRGS